jgi:hypothetical protein
MKFRLIASLIVISTGLIIALIRFSLGPDTEKMAPVALIKERGEIPKTKPKSHSNVSIDAKNATAQESESDEDEVDINDQKNSGDASLSQEDIKKITAIANLSETELAKETEALKKRIEDEDLFERLESGDLTKEKEIEIKELIERFALLGLEGTRRKYVAIEPELKDAVYAHRESLKEIREFLNDKDE